MTRVLGLDLSLTATGVAYADGSVGTLVTRATKSMARLDRIRSQVVDYLEARTVHVVAIEGYSYNSRNQGEHLGELGGLIRWTLWSVGFPYVDIPPACVKKYATGKGNAGKGEVLEAAINRSGGLGFGGDNNRADAWWLRQMALAHYGDPEAVPMPAAHRDALAKVAWPELGEAAA